MPDDPLTPSALADLAALSRLWDDHRPKLLAVVRGRLAADLRRLVDPEDVLTDAYLDSRRKWPRFHEHAGSAYFWLYRIVIDRYIETHRKAHRGPNNLNRRLPWPEPSAELLALHLSQTGPGTAAEKKELRGRVRAALDQLDPDDRQILWLRYFEYLSSAEAADVLGIAEPAARKRHERALDRLRPFLPGGMPG